MSYQPESLLKPHYKKYKNRSYTSDELIQHNNDLKLSQTLKLSERDLIYPENFKAESSAYEIRDGFYYIPNPFSVEATLRMMIDAITKWPTAINRMNLDIEAEKPDDVWKTSLEQIKTGSKMCDSWLHKLRWCSLGYHYQWTQRMYKPECRSVIPTNLESVMKDIVALLGWPEFIPEAAIVNYYHLNSAMCFHQDHAEIARDVPLVSISLGQPAVYLLGTSDATDTPIPVTLYHGDVVVMSGPSRLAYHAVPKVIGSTQSELMTRLLGGTTNESDIIRILTDLLDESCCVTASNQIMDKELIAKLMWQYISKSRINVNMRQVLHKGQAFPQQC